MRLWLLRHAKSSWDDDRLADRDRPLAPRGERDADHLAEHLVASDVRPALVLCSAGLRARQTLGRVFHGLGDAFEVRVEPGLYTFDASTLLSRLRSVLDDVPSVMIVGHNPALQELALTLVDRGDGIGRLAAKFPTCALADIELRVDAWREAAPATGTLLGLTIPRDLGADA